MLKTKWWHKAHDIEWMSYVWLVFIPYSVVPLLPADNLASWLWLALLGVFLILYILVIEINRWRKITIPLEVLVAGLFALFNMNDYLIIFPAWQVAFILAREAKKYFYWFIIAYYFFLLGGMLRDALMGLTVFSWQNGNLLNLLFPLLSPFMAYAVSRSIYRQRQLRQTNRRLESIIQRNERERIARDLHDTLGQSFSMITIKTELVKKLLVKAPEKVGPELDDIARTSRENLQMVRTIVNGLHQQSLSEALLEQSRNLAAAHVWLDTTGEDDATKWPTAIQGRLAAVLVEAITNVMRHAHADQVQLTFSESATDYQVRLVDDGHGGQLVRDGSNGIAGMRARMLEGHGKFAITSNRHGTEVRLQLPKGVV